MTTEGKMLDEHEEFLRQLERCELEPSRFDHAGHVLAAWLYLRAHGWQDGASRFTATLIAYATHLGAPQKYHLTMTHAFLRIVAWRSTASDWPTFVADNGDLFSAARELLETHYSPELLHGARAKREWVEPDRAPLPAMPPWTAFVATPARRR
jgi:hypothetical protein